MRNPSKEFSVEESKKNPELSSWDEVLTAKRGGPDTRRISRARPSIKYNL